MRSDKTPRGASKRVLPAVSRFSEAEMTLTSGKKATITLLTVLFAGAVAQAQNPGSQTPAGQIARPAVEDVQIIIQSQQVRIATRSSIDHMQLKVSDQTGNLIFDSGLWTANEVTWPLQMA